MKVKTLFNNYPTDAIINKMIYLYKDMRGSESIATKVLNQLKCANTKALAEFEVVVQESGIGDETWVDISGIEKGDDPENPKDYLALEYVPWREWLNATVIDLIGLDGKELAAHIFWEMTFVSFSEEERDAEARRIRAIVDSYDPKSN